MCSLDGGACFSQEVVIALSIKYLSVQPLRRKLTHVVIDARVRHAQETNNDFCLLPYDKLRCICIRIVAGYLLIRRHGGLLPSNN